MVDDPTPREPSQEAQELERRATLQWAQTIHARIDRGDNAGAVEAMNAFAAQAMAAASRQPTWDDAEAWLRKNAAMCAEIKGSAIMENTAAIYRLCADSLAVNRPLDTAAERPQPLPKEPTR